MLKYRTARIGLITFTIGLSSVWSSDAARFGVREVPLEIPKTKSGTIVVRPAVGVENISPGGGYTLEETSDVETYFNSEAGKAYLRRRNISK